MGKEREEGHNSEDSVMQQQHQVWALHSKRTNTHHTTPHITQVQQQAKKLFERLQCDPTQASVNFKGREKDRYIFIRAKGTNFSGKKNS